MSSTWIIGDLHGCADELADLVGRIAPGANDRLIAVGDLWHRGPDPVGVMEIMREHEIRFILGNHEHRILERCALLPASDGELGRTLTDEALLDLNASDMAGDGGRPLIAAPKHFPRMLRFLLTHSGYFIENGQLEEAGPTLDGRAWCAVHAGIWPGRHPSHSSPSQLCTLRRLPMPGRPFWYEVYTGPNLVIFGHTPSRTARLRYHRGSLVAAGVDTGCVYGGSLTAYSPELDTWMSVPCRRPEGYARP